MAKTSHGYLIPGTLDEGPPSKTSHRCGGPNNDCATCKRDIDLYRLREAKVEREAIKIRIRRLVKDFIINRFEAVEIDIPPFEVEVIWLDEDLKSDDWVASAKTTLEEEHRYEIAYNSTQKMTRIRSYGITDEVFVND